jgi:hypothetical protein
VILYRGDLLVAELKPDHEEGGRWIPCVQRYYLERHNYLQIHVEETFSSFRARQQNQLAHISKNLPPVRLLREV